ncbi:uncharacterized protein ATNIH1004_001669 [Aspergillus tanneri]|uniref:Uncharacterized protein n=1 Tax=Aspergillus tanneri TaxID=1220188 RepID=A0A5M9N5B1_9EURO|nr:uncharacterized protein ATNIH1004_001669 [Aspergillus tanneri]KAA8652764.1 hypothetical protein ATNIH1004_001669 [Aspergillus tanneri]
MNHYVLYEGEVLARYPQPKSQQTSGQSTETLPPLFGHEATDYAAKSTMRIETECTRPKPASRKRPASAALDSSPALFYGRRRSPTEFSGQSAFVGADRKRIRSGLYWKKFEIVAGALVEEPEVCGAIGEAFKAPEGRLME